MWTVKISSQAGRFYASLQGREQARVAAALDQLAQDPRTGKSLRGELKGYWSYRVGVYRILYSIEEHEVVVHILRIQHRKEVYERFRR
ncbi:MAG: type II toxin-antitoxin system RelE/ParE family toxin [bacterium]